MRMIPTTLAILVATAPLAVAQEAPTRPNIVFMLVDTPPATAPAAAPFSRLPRGPDRGSATGCWLGL